MSHATMQIVGWTIIGGMMIFVVGPFLICRLFPDAKLPDRWLLPGKLITDYGTVFEKDNWICIQRQTVALCEKKGLFFLVFRSGAFTPLGWGIQHSKVPLEKISILKDVIADVERVQNERLRGTR